MKPNSRFLIIGIIVFAFLISPAATAKETNKSTFNNIMFSDVDKTHKNFNAIYFLYNTDIINGYKQEKSVEFRPDNKINRAEFLKLMMEGSKKSNHKEYKKCFNDVNTGEWYSTYVCQAKEEGIINGYTDGSFRPDQTITEVEALKILGKLSDWKINESETEQWYKPYVDFADQHQLLTDKNRENEKMTRGDMAEIIFRNTEVEEFKTDKFEEKLVDDIFYNHDIPYGGPLGPGGILGPGGAFGKTGAFDDSAYFAGEKDKFELLDEDFYKNHYCYYSDKGDFRTQVEEILNYISGGKTDDMELAGYDTDGFGLMFCYSGIAATDLELFTKELRDQYEVKCWFDPMSSKETKGSYERLLCYSEPGKPKWLTEDPNMEISGNQEITAGGEGAKLKFFLTDNESSPIVNRKLTLIATTGIDSWQNLEVKEEGEGLYSATFAPKLAGLYVLTLVDEETGTKNDVTLRVNPGQVDHVQIVDRLNPNQSLQPNKASIRVVAKDKYDNTVPYSSVDNNLTAITTLGKIEGNHYNDIFNFDLEVDDWGTAEISFMLNGSIIGDQAKFDFFPIQIDMPKGISLSDKQVQAPVYIYFPSKYGKIGSYDFKIKYNSKGLNFKNLIDFDDKDKVTMPLFDVQNGFIHVWQPKTEVNSDNPQILPIGTILFDVISTGEGTVYASDAVLKDNEGNNASGEISGFSDGLWGGTHKVKATRNICVEAFVMPLPPGAGGAPVVAVTPAATEAEIVADVAQANAIFKAIAQSCNCNTYLNFELKTPVKNLSYAEVDGFDDNHNGIIESDGDLNDGHADEIDKMMANNPAGPNCIPVYYTREISLGGGSLMGISYSSASSNGVAVNNNFDGDGRTLAHELAHQLSGGEVDDPDKPDAHAEGADQAGNLMNYDNTGDILTPKQCEEIEKKLP